VRPFLLVRLSARTSLGTLRWRAIPFAVPVSASLSRDGVLLLRGTAIRGGSPRALSHCARRPAPESI